MMKTLGIALGAGVTSALLFAVTTTATSPGLLLAYLAPLPVMIAGLGFTAPAGAMAAVVGAVAIGAALGRVPGVLFLVLLGLPAWYLTRLATLNRPAPPATPATGQAGGTEWFPVPGLMLRLAALAAGPVLLAGVAVVWRFGGYEAAVSTMAGRLAELFGRDGLPGDFAFVDIVRLAPAAIAASSAVMLSVNLWLAARAVLISERLARPWPNLPDALHMPRGAAVAFAALAAGVLLPGAFGIAAAVMAAALGMVFVFEGLALAHVLTRGFAGRRGALAAIYVAVVFLMPWPLFALAVLGCIDCLVPLRGRARITIIKRPTRRS